MAHPRANAGGTRDVSFQTCSTSVVLRLEMELVFRNIVLLPLKSEELSKFSRKNIEVSSCFELSTSRANANFTNPV